MEKVSLSWYGKYADKVAEFEFWVDMMPITLVFIQFL